MNVKIKKLIPEATIPSYANPGDAGMDLTATSIRVTDAFIEYGTGLAIEIPEGFVGLIFPRSSNSKKDLILSNSVGVVDSGYRGEFVLRFRRTPSNREKMHLDTYYVGDKVGQLIILPYPIVKFEEVEDLTSSERGSSGFGSTGN